jgi:hypothetical protein
MPNFDAMKQALAELEEYLEGEEARQMAEGPDMTTEADGDGAPAVLAVEVGEAEPKTGVCPTCGKPYGPGHPKH